MDLPNYLRMLRRRFWVLVVCPLVACVIAVGISISLPAVYEARVTLLVRPAAPLAATDPSITGLTSDQISATYASLMVERPLLERVTRELNLNRPPDALRRDIVVVPEPNTTILNVTVRDGDPRRARDIANRLVADFIAQVRDIQQQEAGGGAPHNRDNLVIVTAAVIPERPSSPNLSLNVGLALAAGLILGVGSMFVLEHIDNSVRDAEEVTERLDLPVLGHIPEVRRTRRQGGDLVALVDGSPAGECYRVLRTNLIFSASDRDVNVIVVTSPNRGEGKSDIAANLAIVIAKVGLRTLLIDANLRHPTQHLLFTRLPNLGLSNMILDDVDDGDMITPVKGVQNLWLLTSGETQSNPSELLSSARAHQLLSNLASRFSYLIIDAPAVNVVTDALVLAASADAAILVVERGRTSYPSLQHAKRSLDGIGARTFGAVMNRSRGSVSPSYTSRAVTPLHEGHPARPRAVSERRRTRRAEWK